MDIDLNQPFGLRLRSARQLAGKTQTESAAKVGISQSQWNVIESGRWQPEKTYLRLLEKNRHANQEQRIFIGARAGEKRLRLQAVANAVNCDLRDLLPEEADYDENRAENPVEGTCPPGRES